MLTFEERNRGVYIQGVTGSGKTTFTKWRMYEDIRAGKGIIYIDPHGPDALDLLDNIPKNRTEDVRYICPGSRRTYVPLQLSIDPVLLVEDLKDIWGEALSDRAQYYLLHGLQLIKDNPGKTLADLKRIYWDPTFREKLLRSVTNPETVEFWGNEYEIASSNVKGDAPQTIFNKVGQLLFTPAIKQALSDKNNPFSLETAIRFNEIVVVNLAKGQIGEGPASLLGALILAHIKNVLMSETVKECRLYVSEFQNFGTNVFADMLSELRKFGLCLTLEHQFLAQLRPAVQMAILGNVGTIVAFRNSPFDAPIMNPFFDSREHQDQVESSLSSQPPYHYKFRSIFGDIRSGSVERFTTTDKGSLSRVLAASGRRFERPIIARLPRPSKGRSQARSRSARP